MALRANSSRPLSLVRVITAIAGLLTVSTIAGAQVRFNVLHAFGDPGVLNPNGPLLLASDGNFYGTALQGGACDAGTLFRMTPAGSVTLMHTFFANSIDGGFPAAGLIQASDGHLYGTTETGGNGNPGGTIFRLTLAGVYTTLYNLNGTSDGQDVYAGLTQGTDGDLYGTATFGGAGNSGTAFKISTGGTFTLLHAFNFTTEGANPNGGLVQGNDGNFYGTTTAGGSSNNGTVFRMTPQGVVTVLRMFSGGPSDGAAPWGPLMKATDGNIYGLASGRGGPTNNGAAFRISSGGAVQILHMFDYGTEGSAPLGGFIQATDGNLYSTLFNGSSAGGFGSVFKMTTAAPFTVTVVHAFNSDDGGSPFAGVTQGADGSLYGGTFYGGAFDAGVLFKVTTGGAYTLMKSLGGGTDASHSIAPMIRATDGNFYGTGQAGGTSDAGAVFKMTPAGAVTVIYSFNVHDEAGHPTAALVQANDGNFYIGTGSTLIRLTPAGARTVVHELTYATEGYGPSTMIQAADGLLYGTTDSGGGGGRGTIFRMTLGGAFTVLSTFSGSTDGRSPRSIIQGTDGNFYGTTSHGGPSDAGTVYKMTPSGTRTNLHSFAPGSEGSFPYGALIQATDGSFYGTTYSGGSTGGGTAWKITAGGAFTVLHTFITSEPYLIQAGLVQGADGNFYGGSVGGSAGYGAVFKMTPSGTVTTLHAFANTDGSGVYTELTLAPGRHLYGTTTLGGPLFQFGPGVAFHINTAAVTADFDGDGRADLTTFRPSDTKWRVSKSGTNYTMNSTYTWGASTDVPVTGDYDGDGTSDIAVFRPSNGTWYILQSSTNFTAFMAVQWGASADKVAPGDYDGDGKTDIAVYRPSTGTWYILQSSTNFTAYIAVQWGVSTDVAVQADYDGDGRSDIAVFRPSTGAWFILRSSTNFTMFVMYTWGTSGDVTVPGDYDGDGKAEPAVFRPSTGVWAILKSTTNYTTFFSASWGTTGDIAVPGDFDGDGKTDIAVFRPSTATWLILRSSSNYTTFESHVLGASGDSPVLHRP